MKHCLLAIVAFTVAVTALADDKPKLKLGQTLEEEWKGKFFKISATCFQHAAGNSRGYALDLEHDKVRVSDSDRNTETLIDLNNKFGMELRKDPKGEPTGVSVRINKWMYHDLNCDGEWDARNDNRDATPKRFIWLNDQWVQVKYHHGRFGVGNEVSFFDEKTEYQWDGKAWNTKPTKR
jgi:hypothetical protein